MATSVIAKIEARVNWIIGARSTAFDATVGDDRYIQEEIRRAIIETESEIVHAICEAYHPMRTLFLVWSADLANEALIPHHIGQIEAIKIKPYSAAGTYAMGESTTRENIRMWRENYLDIFDVNAHDVALSRLAGYYNITNNTLSFTGNVAQAYLCNYVPDYTTPALQIDSQLDNLLVAGAILRLNKLGMPQALIGTYAQLYSAGMSMLRQGLTTMPELPTAQVNE